MIMYFHNDETNSIDYELILLYYSLMEIFPNISVETDNQDFVKSILI
jgi:hypothetical protein